MFTVALFSSLCETLICQTSLLVTLKEQPGFYIYQQF